MDGREDRDEHDGEKQVMNGGEERDVHNGEERVVNDERNESWTSGRNGT